MGESPNSNVMGILTANKFTCMIFMRKNSRVSVSQSSSNRKNDLKNTYVRKNDRVANRE